MLLQQPSLLWDQIEMNHLIHFKVLGGVEVQAQLREKYFMNLAVCMGALSS